MNTYEQVINHYGETAQKEKAIEELSELITEIENNLGGSYNRQAMLSEMADVYNMFIQLMSIYKFEVDELVSECERKMQRTLDRINK